MLYSMLIIFSNVINYQKDNCPDPVFFQDRKCIAIYALVTIIERDHNTIFLIAGQHNVNVIL